MVFKLVEAAQKTWRRLDGNNQLPKLILDVKFADGLEVAAKAILLGTVEAPDKGTAIKKGAQKFKAEAWRLYAVPLR